MSSERQPKRKKMNPLVTMSFILRFISASLLSSYPSAYFLFLLSADYYTNQFTFISFLLCFPILSLPLFLSFHSSVFISLLLLC